VTPGLVAPCFLELRFLGSSAAGASVSPLTSPSAVVTNCASGRARSRADARASSTPNHRASSGAEGRSATDAPSPSLRVHIRTRTRHNAEGEQATYKKH